jgi:hypothetical protein
MYKRVNIYNSSLRPLIKAAFNRFTKFPLASAQLTQGHVAITCACPSGWLC